LFNILTTEREKIIIENYGFHNSNSGPDFLEGAISLNGIKWVGHIEMHILSSDWLKHKHDTDEKYANVILHVVWEEDEIIYRKDGTRIPCIEMRELIPDYLLKGYKNLMNRNEIIICGKELRSGDTDVFILQLHRIFVERLEQKCLPISNELEERNQDWSQVLFFMISKSLGLKVNADAMGSLSRIVPNKLLSKHGDQLKQIEAILFGQAGLLTNRWKDKYPLELRKEYRFLKKKYDLKPLSGV
jgi:hypothetical protein